jgi:hypothetical protein
MSFTLKNTSTITQNKKPLIAFSLGVVLAMPIANSLGFDGGLSHYTLLGLLFAISFMLYLVCKAVLVFIEATFEPRIIYSDFVAVKHIDLPAIPDEKELYAYMNKADKMHMKGATRLHDSVLKQYNVDRFGNVR